MRYIQIDSLTKKPSEFYFVPFSCVIIRTISHVSFTSLIQWSPTYIHSRIADYFVLFCIGFAFFTNSYSFYFYIQKSYKIQMKLLYMVERKKKKLFKNGQRDGAKLNAISKEQRYFHQCKTKQHKKTVHK